MTTYTTKGLARRVGDQIWISLDGSPITYEGLRKQFLDDKRSLEGRLRKVNQEIEKIDKLIASKAGDE